MVNFRKNNNWSLYAVLGIGSILFILGIIHTIVLSDNYILVDELVELLFLSGPPAGILVTTYWVRRTQLRDDYLPTLAYWSFGGAVTLLGLGVILLFYFGDPLLDHDALFLYQFHSGLGAFGGAVIGFHKVRSVTRAKEVQYTKEQRDNLETLNQVLRHDIRNDLQIVQTYAEMAEDHVDEEGLGYLATVQESAKSAVELTQKARDFTELILQPAAETQQVLYTDPLEQQISELQSTYSDAVITVDGPLPRTEVVGNEMLGSVFRNVLQNAILHNDKDVPEVTIRAQTEGEMVEVRITDNGPGVSDVQKETIFGKGEKGLDSEGTGIGLYLVQTLVGQYGGDIWVEDNNPDGSVFVVQLPIAE